MTRLLLADDHRIFLDGLSSMLAKETDLEIMACLDTGEAVIKYVHASPPDLVVLDISMPGKNGIDVARELSRTHPQVKTLLLSMHDQKHRIQAAMEAGVDGYLLKTVSKDELLFAIQNIMAGRNHFSAEVTNILYQSTESGQVTSTNLTRRELDVLRLIAKSQTNDEIAKQLYLSVNTIKTHRKNLLFKLNARNTAGLVAYVYENDLM